MSNKVHSHIFLLLKNIDHRERVLKILNNIYLKQFQSRYPCSEINFERTQIGNYTELLCKDFDKDLHNHPISRLVFSFSSFETSTSKSNTYKDFASKGFSIPQK